MGTSDSAQLRALASTRELAVLIQELGGIEPPKDKNA